MSQRASGYARKRDDNYETPAWVVQALIPHLHLSKGGTLYQQPPGESLGIVWDPAAGSGKMSRAFKDAGFETVTTDIRSNDNDFFNFKIGFECDAIVTNPPFSISQKFIEHALGILVHFPKRVHDFDPDVVPNRRLTTVAMLLRTDYDHAVTRQHLFAKNLLFSKKLVLTKRIVWFEPKVASPSFNHAWFIWDYRHSGPPVLAYDIQEKKEV